MTKILYNETFLSTVSGSVPKAMGPKYSIDKINFSCPTNHVIKKDP
jgi:hypothetical protein